MPPTSSRKTFFAPGDCKPVSMGRLFDNILSSSINSICSDSSDDGRSPKCEYGSNEKKSRNPPWFANESSASQHNSHASKKLSTQDTRLSPVIIEDESSWSNSSSGPMNNLGAATSQVKPASFRDRRRKGLSINLPPIQSDPHTTPPSPPIFCSKNVELRRKSLTERHFFRPVSEDEESKVSQHER